MQLKVQELAWYLAQNSVAGKQACNLGDKALSFYHSFISQLLYNLPSGAFLAGFFGEVILSLDYTGLMKNIAWLKNTLQRQQRCVLGH